MDPQTTSMTHRGMTSDSSNSMLPSKSVHSRKMLKAKAFKTGSRLFVNSLSKNHKNKFLNTPSNNSNSKEDIGGITQSKSVGRQRPLTTRSQNAQI